MCYEDPRDIYPPQTPPSEGCAGELKLTRVRGGAPLDERKEVSCTEEPAQGEGESETLESV